MKKSFYPLGVLLLLKLVFSMSASAKAASTNASQYSHFSVSQHSLAYTSRQCQFQLPYADRVAHPATFSPM